MRARNSVLSRSVKHGIPCGVGTGDTLHRAYLRAREGDPISAFGGIVALNRPVDALTAEALTETFLEAVIAPAFAEDAAAALARKKNLRVMEVGPFDGPARPPGWDVRRVRGGRLVQDRDARDLVEAELRVVTSRPLTEREWADLRFAWTVCRYVRSNAIVFARDRQVESGLSKDSQIAAIRNAAAPGAISWPTRCRALSGARDACSETRAAMSVTASRARRPKRRKCGGMKQSAATRLSIASAPTWAGPRNIPRQFRSWQTTTEWSP